MAPACCNHAQNRTPVHLTRRLVAASFVALLPVRRVSAESLLEQAKKIEYGLLDGSIRSCPSNLNPNCISTSSTGYASYAAPWRSRGESVEEVMETLKRIVPRVCSETQLLVSETTSDGAYLRFEVGGRFGRDVVEFAIKHADAATSASADTGAPLVFYRSIAKEVKYIYPFTQPISDRGAQKKRMDGLRELLRWQRLGCELLECYE